MPPRSRTGIHISSAHSIVSINRSKSEKFTRIDPSKASQLKPKTKQSKFKQFQAKLKRKFSMNIISSVKPIIPSRPSNEVDPPLKPSKAGIVLEPCDIDGCLCSISDDGDSYDNHGAFILQRPRSNATCGEPPLMNELTDFSPAQYEAFNDIPYNIESSNSEKSKSYESISDDIEFNCPSEEILSDEHAKNTSSSQHIIVHVEPPSVVHYVKVLDSETILSDRIQPSVSTSHNDLSVLSDLPSPPPYQENSPPYSTDENFNRENTVLQTEVRYRETCMISRPRSQSLGSDVKLFSSDFHIPSRRPTLKRSVTANPRTHRSFSRVSGSDVLSQKNINQSGQVSSIKPHPPRLPKQRPPNRAKSRFMNLQRAA
eukprot:293532_1